MYTSTLKKKRSPFGMEEKYMNFEGYKSYGKNSYKALWSKGIFPNNSYEIPMDWPIVKEFWRKQNMSSNLLFSFLCFSYIASKDI
jgi:hypothetical protein